MAHFGLISFFCLILSIHQILGLRCYNCNGPSAPLCEGDHKKGVVLECPMTSNDTEMYPKLKHWLPQYFDRSDTNLDQMYCYIMKTVSHSQGTIEISKGCTYNGGYFITGREHNSNIILSASETNPQCYEHSDKEITRGVDTHEVWICFCKQDTKDGCNAEDIKGIGREDIKQREQQEKSGACAHSATALYLIIMFIVRQIEEKLYTAYH